MNTKDFTTTPTPRTDAVVAVTGTMYGVVPEGLAALARQLERELAAAQEAKEAVTKHADWLGEQLDAAQERNTHLVKALDDMHGTPCEQIRHQQELQAAQEALAKAEATAEQCQIDTEIAERHQAAAEARAESYRLALAEIREEWAGAECGEPVTAQEGYAIQLAKRMYQLAVDAIAEGK